MARIDKNGIIRGVVGPAVFRVLNGKQVMGGKADHVRQTAATKNAAENFGASSRISKMLKLAIIPLTSDFDNDYMQARLNKAINVAAMTAQAGAVDSFFLQDADLSSLSGFEFNTMSPFGKYFTIEPGLELDEERRLTIFLPEFGAAQVITAPREAREAVVCYVVTSIDPMHAIKNKFAIAAQTVSQAFRTEVHLPYDTIESQVWKSEPLEEGRIVFVTAALFLFRNYELTGLVGMNSKTFHPSGIITAFTT